MLETDDRTLKIAEPSKQPESDPPSVKQLLATQRVPPPSYVPPDPVMIVPLLDPEDPEGPGPELEPPGPTEVSVDSAVAQPHRPSASAANPATISDLGEISTNRHRLSITVSAK